MEASDFGDRAGETSERQESGAPATPRGGVKDVGVLDLSSAKTAADISAIGGLKDVGVVLVPEHLIAALMGVPMKDVGAVIPIPQGENAVVFTGQTKLTGEMLAAGDAKSTLIGAGQIFVTTKVSSVGYAGLYLTGQIFAPRGSETALAGKIRRLAGQLIYYPEGARFLSGHDVIGREFLELLPAPQPLFISGHCEIAQDVTPELLRSKIGEIVVIGHLSVPAHLHAAMQVMTTENLGHISVHE